MILGIDIGGTNTDIVLFTNKFEHITSIPTKNVKSLTEIVQKYCPDVNAVGVGIAAWIKNNRIIKAPNIEKLPNLEINKPCVIENDANCFAYFAAKTLSKKNLVGITVGSGVGSGIVINGKIYRGCGIAGEIGHINFGGKRLCSCGERGHVEAYFGGKALKDAKKFLESGKIYSTLGFRLFCKAIAASIMLLNPEAIAIGGRIGGRLKINEVVKMVLKFANRDVLPEFYNIRDDFAVAKGAAMLAADTIL